MYTKDVDIICIDEVTLDTETNQKMHNILFEYAQTKILIFISHSIENIDKYDRIYVMNNGKIIEQGHYSIFKIKA